MRPLFASTITAIMEKFQLVDPLPDEDGLYEGRICTLDQARIIQNLSWLALFGAIIAAYKNYYAMSILSLIVWGTSLLYWSNPTYGIRRNIDIFFVMCALGLHLWNAFYSTHKIPYYILTTIGVAFYSVGAYYQRHNLAWAACFFHGGVHVLAHISNLILYFGVII